MRPTIPQPRPRHNQCSAGGDGSEDGASGGLVSGGFVSGGLPSAGGAFDVVDAGGVALSGGGVAPGGGAAGIAAVLFFPGTVLSSETTRYDSYFGATSI